MRGIDENFIRGVRFVFQPGTEREERVSRGKRVAALTALFLAVAAASSAAQGLRFTPLDETTFIGVVGGPYLPAQALYTLHNGSTRTVPWIASATEPWVYLWESSGTLLPGDEVTIPVSIDLSAAGLLGAGSYHATLNINDLSNGLNSHRGLSLTLVNAGPLLTVFPDAGFESSGEAGGAFTPASQRYAFANLGNTDLSWSAWTGAPWLTVSRQSGILQPGQLEFVEVAIDSAGTAALVPGLHSTMFALVNASNGLGSVDQEVTLSVSAATSAMDVTPLGDWVTSGPQGGPFPSRQSYVVENVGGTTIAWSAYADSPWVGLSVSSGILDPGGSQVVDVAIDPLVGPQLGLGSYGATVFFTNDSGGTGSTTRGVSLTVEAPTAWLSVDSATGFTSSGPPGGPFVPDEKIYSLTNTGNAPLAWSASADVSWILISKPTGVLAAGEHVDLMVMIDPVVAAALPAGSYSGGLSFLNMTNGAGSTTLPTQLLIQVPTSSLALAPSTGFTATGLPGGPFSPPDQFYELRNVSSSSVTWLSARTVSWIELSSYVGTLAPGTATSIRIAIAAGMTASLPSGLHEGYVVFGDPANPAGLLVIKVQLVLSSGGGSVTLSQFGITWTFDQAYPSGQFANGDWWVVGPVTVVGIDPPSTTSGGRTSNGSMVNPSPTNGWTQGYDSSMYGQYKAAGSFDQSLNVALDVSTANPLHLAPHSSLVSTISMPLPDSRPQLRTAAVLTVLPAVPPPGSFRPPTSGNDKTIRHNVSQLNYSLLASLHSVSSEPELGTVERWFERPWIDHVPDWIGTYTHPIDNMEGYGREIADQVGTATLILNLDKTNQKKELLLTRLVQVGIDLYGIVQDGGENNWPAGGGHHSGRKWPILFAGLMLGDSAMSGIGFQQVAFNEDDQTFAVEETSPGVYNYGQGGYGPQHVGMAEWGSQHWKQINRGQLPFFDDSDWFGDPYRICCTANAWWGEVLSARIMGAMSLWNHDPLFYYLDRYRAVAPTTGQAQWTIGWTEFSLDMWDVYRPSF